MVMPPLVGHADPRQRLAEAFAGNRLPQVLLLAGPQGIGKQRLALWLGQRLLCTNAAGTEPCGSCRPCRLVLGLAHPDLHWIIPIPRPKVSDADKAVDAVAEQLEEIYAARRAQPLWASPDGMASHGIASVRLVQRKASMTPVESRFKVFILGDAERLVPQEASQEAANALLKLLEEPPADSFFVLTATDPRRLLPTMRSRCAVLRLQPLADAEMRQFVMATRDPAPSGKALDRLLGELAGAPGRLAGSGTGSDGARVAAEQVLEAVAGGAAARMEIALRQGPFAARGDFTEMLEALGAVLGDAARESAGAGGRTAPATAVRAHTEPLALARAVDLVAAARERARGNVNPQLVLATLTSELQEVLHG